MYEVERIQKLTNVTTGKSLNACFKIAAFFHSIKANVW